MIEVVREQFSGKAVDLGELARVLGMQQAPAQEDDPDPVEPEDAEATIVHSSPAAYGWSRERILHRLTFNRVRALQRLIVDERRARDDAERDWRLRMLQGAGFEMLRGRVLDAARA